MQLFDDDTFRAFLGEPISTLHNWGEERRFSVSKQKLITFGDMLRDTLYHHHSSFSLHDEIEELGFVLSAQELKKHYSGNPTAHNTQMGNLGEILGANFARTFMSFRGSSIYPKRYNTNVEQSMKGIDVLSFKDSNSSPKILIGEVKTSKDFDKRVIEEAYNALIRHKKNDQLPIIMHFARAQFQDDKVNLANVERHIKKGTPRRYLLLSVTETSPREPFSDISEYEGKYGKIEKLLAVHIEITELMKYLPSLYIHG